MKNLYATGFLVVLLCAAVALNAQEPVTVRQHIPDKPQLFAALPELFECVPPNLERLSHSRTTDTITLQFGKLLFIGEIIERVQQTPQVESINIRSHNYPGAMLNLSVFTDNNNTQKIVGRIIHPDSGDVLILDQENGRYYMRKRLQKFFMTE
jgi:hypothetical protein